MFNSSHIRSRKKLILESSGKIRLHFSSVLRSRMRDLWLRKRLYGKHKGSTLGSIYAEAFEQFLLRNKIPKVIPKVIRETRKLELPESAIHDLQSLKKIALKRNQPLNVVIEEALEEYLSHPENYLGKDLEISRPVERISS